MQDFLVCGDGPKKPGIRAPGSETFLNKTDKIMGMLEAKYLFVSRFEEIDEEYSEVTMRDVLFYGAPINSGSGEDAELMGTIISEQESDSKVGRSIFYLDELGEVCEYRTPKVLHTSETKIRLSIQVDSDIVGHIVYVQDISGQTFTLESEI